MKYKFSKRLTVTVLTVFSLIVTNSAHSTTLTGSLQVDNAHTTYVSTDNALDGDIVSSGADWTNTDTLSGLATDLAVGQNYFLHVFASNLNGPSGFIGEFSLSGTDHEFANGSTDITTNDVDWFVSLLGWPAPGVLATKHADNGSGVWGSNANSISSDADWIWLSDNEVADSDAYFSLAINATSVVPVPAAVWLFGSGLIGLVGMRRKSKSSKLSV